MRKRIKLSLIGCIAIIFLAFSFCFNVTAATMTEAHIEHIRSNCVSAKDSLNRLHTSDALLRVNAGQLYESLGAKLIASFNNRVAINKLDGTHLVNITTNYEQELTSFRQSYIVYERQLAAVIEIDCRKQPVTFYDAVAKVRAKRMAVYNNVTRLQGYIDNYSAEFTEFSANYTAAASGFHYE
jgi:hypothetical protein